MITVNTALGIRKGVLLKRYERDIEWIKEEIAKAILTAAENGKRTTLLLSKKDQEAASELLECFDVHCGYSFEVKHTSSLPREYSVGPGIQSVIYIRW